MTEMLSRVHVFISGRVQGVAYRYFAERRAAETSVTGWVRNLSDGRVEIFAEGEKADLECFLEILQQGPRMAKVDDLNLLWEDYVGEFEDFRIKYSAY
jgi:acylphosphatase